MARAGAWIALGASLPELYLQTVDISGGAIFSGVELSVVWRLLTRTATGWVWISRSALLVALLAVLAARPGIGRTMEGSRTWSGVLWWVALVLGAAALTSRALASHASALASGSLAAIGADGLHVLADRKSTRLNSSHIQKSRMPSSA